MKQLKHLLCLVVIIIVVSCTSDKKSTTKVDVPTTETKDPTTTPPPTITTTANTRTSAGINTAAGEAYMTGREKEMIKEINLIRSNPKGYIPIVEKFREQLKQTDFVDPNQINMEMEAVNSLVSELSALEPLSILKPRQVLHNTAKNHGLELKSNNRTGHNGMNGSWPWDRIQKDDPEAGPSGENLVGGVPGVRDAVLTLLVDTGIPGYGHRKNLLDPRWEYVGCYEVDQVTDLKHYWVQNFMKLK